MAKAAFKKGQEVYVTFVHLYNGKATYEKMTVASCGAKEMTLTRNTGDMLGCVIYAREYGTRVFAASAYETEAQAFAAMQAHVQGELEQVRAQWAAIAADPATRVDPQRIKDQTAHYAQIQIEWY